MKRAALIVAFLIALGLARIISTYFVLNHTMDEPLFISSGLEWLTQRTHTYVPEHPPLSQIPSGIGAWLAGAHNIAKADFPGKTVLILYNSRSYYRTLSFARAGELPFFIFAAWIVWLWARRLHGTLAGVAAVLLFTTMPTVLAHAGLATTDMAICATVPAALYAFIRWLDNPGWKSAVLMGLAVAAGILSKFTFLLFFPVSVAVVFCLSWKREERSRILGSQVVSLALAVIVCCVAVWACYWFDISPLFRGIHDIVKFNRTGWHAYLFGEKSNGGWWYFFPVVFAYKTPLAFFCILALGLVWLWRAPREHWIPLACAAAILVSVMPGRINIGVRHVLPMYPLLAITAGLGAARLIQSASRGPRIAGGFLILWQLAVSVVVHPDYIAYFNKLAGERPDLISIDSDLDWGQSFEEVGRRLRQLGITERVGIDLFGNVDPYRHGLTNAYVASPWRPSKGWIVVSATEKYFPWERPPAGSNLRPWAWLDRYQPVESIGGGAVLLYHIPAEPEKTL